MIHKNDNSTPHAASEYDTHISKTIPYYDSFHTETLKLVKTLYPAPATWLDTGCGTGTLVSHALHQFPSTRFFLADPSEKMLSIAKEKLETATISFFHAPTAAITIDVPITVITAIQSHHYLSMPERKEATQVCFDLLQPQGVFITFENICPTTDKAIQIAKDYWRSFQLEAGRGDQTVMMHLKRFGTEYFPITILDHIQLLLETGFNTVELFWYSYMQAGFYCIK